MMESPVLQTNIETKKVNRDNLKKVLLIVLLIILGIVLLIAGFLFGRSIREVPITTDNEKDISPTSAPGIAIGEPNPNTPMPVESELTYTFPQAGGFNMTYTASDWTIVSEPTQVNNYSPTSFAFDNNNLLKLQSTIDPNATIQIYFTKAVSGMLNGNPLSVCNSNYKIIKEISASGTNDGLIRLDQGDSGTLTYSNNYFTSTENTSELCVFNSHPIFKVELEEGGDTGTVLDANDIYWIATMFTRDNSQLDKIDEIAESISFVQF